MEIKLENITFGQACFVIAVVCFVVEMFSLMFGEGIGWGIWTAVAASITGLVGYLRFKYETATSVIGKFMYVCFAVALVLVALLVYAMIGSSWSDTATTIDGGVYR